METYLFEDESFKTEYISTLKQLIAMYENDHNISFEYALEDLITAKIIDWDDNPSLSEDSIIINENEETSICFGGFKSEHSGYLCSNDFGYIPVLNSDLVNFFDLESKSKIINNLELFHPNLYLQRVIISGTEEEQFKCFISDIHLEDDKRQVRITHDESFLFSYKLFKNNHPEPLYLDRYIEVRGESLDLDECRAIAKSFIFEVSCISGVSIIPSANNPQVNNDYFDIEEEFEKKKHEYESLTNANNMLLICSDTEKVIDIYNKGNSCYDNEMSILYFSKVIEYVSETVVRAKITEVGRKALSSNRARMPDANFIKELQDLFQKNTYRKDSESVELTVLTCCYINDLIPLIPSYIKKEFNKLKNKNDDDALGYIASCISATRNNIAHAKANYRATGNEIPEKDYDEFKNLLRIISQQCIRWYAAQSPSMRIVS